MADADVTPPAARADCPHSEAFVIKTRVTRDQHLPDTGLKAWLVYRTSAACFIESRTGPGEARFRRPARRSLIGCPRLVVWLSFGLRGPGVARARRGSRRVCSTRSSVALPAR